MKGYIKIEVTPTCEKGREAMSIEMNIEHVTKRDKFVIIDMLTSALEFSKEEWMEFVIVKGMGSFSHKVDRFEKADIGTPEYEAMTQEFNRIASENGGAEA